ncbi:MAG: response regulator [Elusimicrobiota bacterium]|nr:response regulator [Elusimicrobiota bacterium]
MTELRKDGFGARPGPLDCGEDKDLFIKAANDFIPATLSIDRDGTIYICSVDGGGLFIKRVAKVSCSEPREIADLLKGKSLAGNYKKGSFNRDWVYRINLGLENCRGSLKDSLSIMSAHSLAEIKAQYRAQRSKEAGLREPKTVLVVDDDPNMGLLMSAIFKRDAEELTALLAYDGEEGLAVLFRENVDLLVLNLRMPGMDGYKVLEVMAKDPELRKIPVLMATGTPFLQSAYIGSPDPFGGMYVEWQELPFKPEAMLKRIRRMLMEV